IAKLAGISGTSASSLMGVASNLVKTVLGQQVLQNGLSAAGLGNLLANQKGWLSKLLPSGLTEVPGLSALADVGSAAAEAVVGAATRAGDSVSGAARYG